MGERGWVDEMLERACCVSGGGEVLTVSMGGWLCGGKVVGVWREVEGAIGRGTICEVVGYLSSGNAVCLLINSLHTLQFTTVS
jgi:hypothetical protein